MGSSYWRNNFTFRLISSVTRTDLASPFHVRDDLTNKKAPIRFKFSFHSGQRWRVKNLHVLIPGLWCSLCAPRIIGFILLFNSTVGRAGGRKHLLFRGLVESLVGQSKKSRELDVFRISATLRIRRGKSRHRPRESELQNDADCLQRPFSFSGKYRFARLFSSVMPEKFQALLQRRNELTMTS